MKLLGLILGCAMLLAGNAHAQLAKSDLDTVGIHAKAGATIPENLVFHDISGRATSLSGALDGKPAVMMFADYTCRTLCGTTIAMVSAALADSGLAPGKDFSLVVVGMDPKDTAKDAAAMRANYLEGGLVGPETTFLLGDEQAVAATTRAAGYSYVYDKSADQFAHPTGAFILSPKGAISQVLTSIGLSPETMRLALVQASKGKIGTVTDYVRLLCYCYDPATGKYSGIIYGWLQGLGFATVAGMVLGFVYLMRRRKHSLPAGDTAS